MIAGTFVLEDQSIQFHLTQNGLIEYTVHDATSGVAATKAVGLAEFSAAMHMALPMHMALLGEDNAIECLYERALSAMPKIKDIHDLREMSPAEAEAAVRNLRWIP